VENDKGSDGKRDEKTERKGIIVGREGVRILKTLERDKTQRTSRDDGRRLVKPTAVTRTKTSERT
jgi:hypothetical protein